ncbi:hypothetical protein FJZ26_01820 [Candidatus Parvarchaeota archaeon]|nr:hypothetical protein [Candidatus Parvarchaeota archaeon]
MDFGAKTQQTQAFDLEGKNVCIICQQQTSYLKHKVAEDFVIKAIRAVKTALRVARNNQLYVCDKCFEAYQKKRWGFEQKFVMYGAVGVIIAAVIIGSNLFLRGRFDLYQVFVGLILIVFFCALSLTNHVPGLEGAQGGASPSPSLSRPQPFSPVLGKRPQEAKKPAVAAKRKR